MKYKIPKYKVEQKLRIERKSIVYTLSHPITKEIFYVGATCYPSSRLGQHKKRFGFKPIMEELETVERRGFGYVEVMQAEQYWIHQFKAWGFQLHNKYCNMKYASLLFKKAA